MISKIKYILFTPVDFFLLVFGLVYFNLFKSTPFISYRAMHRLFYIYGGIVTDIINISTRKKIQTTNLKNSKIFKFTKYILQKGYSKYESFLSDKEIKEILKIIKKTKFNLREIDGKISKSPKKKISNIKFDPKKPKAILYEVDNNYLINQKIIQKIILKNDLYQIPKTYFKSYPYFDHISLSITSDFNRRTKADSNAAQLYHFDLDRPKWLKFLTYVNDVDLNNGPHCFIEGTHKNYSIPFSIRSRGYVRLSEEDNQFNKLKKKEVILTAKAGTAIVEDTKGLHKGTKVKKGFRILLNIQINSSMFGCPYNKLKFKKIFPEFKKKFKEKREFFSLSTNINDMV